MNNNDNIVQFTNLSQYPELVHGISTKTMGDMRKESLQKNFLRLLTLSDCSFITLTQVHGSNVVVIRKDLPTTKIKAADGAITKERNRALSVVTADCVPIFLYEPNAKICAVVHAGWKGILGEIVSNAVFAMISQGGSIIHINVAIGPHIGACCYTIDHARSKLFLKKFKKDQHIVFQNNNKWYLDLAAANVMQLTTKGIPRDNIEVPIMCTSCQNDRFFSYRKDSKETFGEMISVIGMR